MGIGSAGSSRGRAQCPSPQDSRGPRSLHIAVELKRVHPLDEASFGSTDDSELAFLQAKKMIATAASYGLASSLSNGTTPNSVCSTPVTMYPQQTMMPYIPAQMANMCEMQLQAPLSSAYEGIPIFIVPQSGVGPSPVSLAAIQRAAEIKVALANAPQEPKIDTSKHHHVFVGDLSPEVDNRAMKEAFSVHGEVSEAKVIRDSQTQKSKGYGFVSFPSKENAEKAIAAMNGYWLGRRPIRTNWATRRPVEDAREKLTFEQIFNSTKPDNTSVYVGNVSTSTEEKDLREPFAVYGEITEIRLFKAQGYAFVRFEKKECATNAIMEMNGKDVCGNAIRCSWGRVQQNSPPTAQVMPDIAGLLAQALLPQPPVVQLPYYPAQYFPHTVYSPPVIPQWQA